MHSSNSPWIIVTVLHSGCPHPKWINVRENWRGNQELSDNPEKLARFGTQDRTKTNKTKNITQKTKKRISKTDPTKSRSFSSLACDNTIVWANLCCVLFFFVLIASSVFSNSYIMALRLNYVVQRLNNNSYTESNSQFTSNVQPKSAQPKVTDWFLCWIINSYSKGV